MTKLIFIFIFFSFAAELSAQRLFDKWSALDSLIWNRKIDKQSAIEQIKIYTDSAIRYANKMKMQKGIDHFPVAGYSKIVFRDDGDDYRDENYDYFDGQEPNGHPAHDIFILDKDSDGVDDILHTKPFAVSAVNGIILSVYNHWKENDRMLSGNYINLFDPFDTAIYFYCHLDSVFVKPGDIVNAGDKLGYIGRTGRRAFKGKTHLHIAYFKIRNGYPVPVDIIECLYKSKKSYQ